MANRRFGPLLQRLTQEPDALVELVQRMPDALLVEFACAVHDEQRRRAVEGGDQDAVLHKAFEQGFGRDGLARQPWVEGGYVVCPGGLVGKNRGNHRCQFVCVEEQWVWESPHLIHEEKRSGPGGDEGFRAVALLPLADGMALDVVRSRMRQGQHQAESVVSYVVRKGKLVEVAQRKVRSLATH